MRGSLGLHGYILRIIFVLYVFVPDSEGSRSHLNEDYSMTQAKKSH